MPFGGSIQPKSFDEKGRTQSNTKEIPFLGVLSH
jgi:hypothetical protein